MTVEPTLPRGYQITVTEAERDHLIAGLELAIVIRRDEPERWIIVADVDCAMFDSLADQLFLAGAPAVVA
jgi:hypothetical protein